MRAPRKLTSRPPHLWAINAAHSRPVVSAVKLQVIYLALCVYGALMSLKQTIAHLTEAAMRNLTEEIARAIRSASFDEVAALNGGVHKAAAAAPKAKASAKAGPKAAAAPAGSKRRGRRPRRSAEQIKATLTTVLGLLKKSPGLRSEQIQKTLKLAKKDLVGPIAAGLEAGNLKKKGERRATAYFAA